MKNKSQSATEMIFLLVLIFIIAGIFLVSTGVLQEFFSKNEFSKNSLLEGAPIGILQANFGSTDVITIQNNFPYDINLTNMSVKLNLDEFVLINQSFLIKESTRFIFNSSFLFSDITCEKGETYGAVFDFTYSVDALENLTFTSPSEYIFVCN